ncbi:MAG: site-specific DNA-methyltransferase [Hyphomonadaceae bacterium]
MTRNDALTIGDASVYLGDCRTVLRALAAEGLRVRTCITSPPYWGLRDYGADGQIGLEARFDDYVTAMVDVFRGVRDVLADDGTLWLNLGDAYVSGGGTGFQGKHGERCDRTHTQRALLSSMPERSGMKPKDLIGMPWRVAFALQADGWYLRQDIIWHKPNPMPESVRDRCTKAHEFVFLLSKSPRYYFDAEAIKEPAIEKASGNKERRPASARGVPVDDGGRTSGAVADSIPWEGSTRNKRSVWTVGSEPYRGAHFATFPTALIEPCVLAGSARGDLVLDPFNGAGTTGMVALRNGRRYAGIELNPDYLALTRQRLSGPDDQARLFG